MAQVIGWFQNKGGTANMPNLTDARFNYYAGKSGLSRSNHVSDHMMKTLGNLGYTTGMLNDRYMAFLKAKTGQSTGTMADLEKIFFANNGLDFA